METGKTGRPGPRLSTSVAARAGLGDGEDPPSTGSGLCVDAATEPGLGDREASSRQGVQVVSRPVADLALGARSWRPGRRRPRSRTHRRRAPHGARSWRPGRAGQRPPPTDGRGQPLRSPVLETGKRCGACLTVAVMPPLRSPVLETGKRDLCTGGSRLTRPLRSPVLETRKRQAMHRHASRHQAATEPGLGDREERSPPCGRPCGTAATEPGLGDREEARTWTRRPAELAATEPGLGDREDRRARRTPRRLRAATEPGLGDREDVSRCESGRLISGTPLRSPVLETGKTSAAPADTRHGCGTGRYGARSWRPGRVAMPASGGAPRRISGRYGARSWRPGRVGCGWSASDRARDAATEPGLGDREEFLALGTPRPGRDEPLRSPVLETGKRGSRKS